MCYDFDAEPPIPPDAGPLVPGTSRVLTSGDGTRFSAWQALAPSQTARAAVVVLPDIRGLFGFYRRLAENFARIGIDALAIDYFGRTAGTDARGADFEFRPHVEQTTYEHVTADIAAAVDELRSSARADAIFVVGFCFGGSYAFMQAAIDTPGLAGAIGFYGGMRQRSPGAPTPITAAPDAMMPVLGLFGGADQGIPPDQVAEFAAGLDESGMEHTIHTYPGAPHSFFDRSYDEHAAECVDAWQRVLAFITGITGETDPPGTTGAAS